MPSNGCEPSKNSLVTIRGKTKSTSVKLTSTQVEALRQHFCFSPSSPGSNQNNDQKNLSRIFRALLSEEKQCCLVKRMIPNQKYRFPVYRQCIANALF